MNIAEQIAALEATRAAKAARLEAITNKTLEENRTKDSAEREEFDTLRDDIGDIDTELKDLRDLEAINKTKATPVQPTRAPASNVSDDTNTRAAASTREGVTVRNTQKLAPGIMFARFAMCLAAAKGDHERAFRLAKNHYGDSSPDIVEVLRAQAESGRSLASVIKANVAAGTTQDATWANPLVTYQNFTQDFIDYLRPMTIVGQFGQNGVPELTRIPFNVRIFGQTSGGSASWVGEGKPKPVTKFDFNNVTAPWTKIAAIAVLTEELIRFSDPAAETLVRQALAGAVIQRMDQDFIDPSKAAVANVSPASITNSVAGISSTGSDADAIREDVKRLWAPFITANNIAARSMVYIMTASTALSLSLMRNTLGQKEFPDISINGGTFEGIPVIVSEYLDNTAGSAGGIVVLVNARDIFLADDGDVTIDISREASVQMDDAPTNDSSTGVEASLVSLWQTNSVGLRAERYVYWAKRRTSAVAWLDAVSW